MRTSGTSRRAAAGARLGMSVLELSIAGTLLALLLFKVAMVLRSSLEFASRDSARATVDEAARELIDKVERAILGSSRESIQPLVAAPLYASGLTFRIPFGVEEGEVVWGPVEAIGLDPEDPALLQWRRAPDTADELSVVWSKLVRPLLEGELQNGIDDNGNGLVDEQGLTFLVQGRALRVSLTLGTRDGATVTHERTVGATIVPRNFEDVRGGIDRPLREAAP